jgi:hypothetical protein
MATPMLALPPTARAGVSIGIDVSVGVPPPELPVYAQPPIPGPGYIWTPGYWAWDPSYGGYYWVPGTWVMPPQIGLLWTPGWWGWSDGFYRWHAGYWGPHVGFYGGVNYGYGYFGNGYAGGEWRGRNFYYNRAVNNINVTTVRNVYVNKTVINNVHTSRVSYNGGHGGLAARPSAQQRAWANQRHVQPTSMQTRQRDVAMRNPAQRFKANQGRPAVFATQHAGDFTGPHAVRAPAPANNHMVAAPQHARPATAAANRSANHRTVAAPAEHARPAAPAPNRGLVQAPHNRPQSARPANPSPRPQPATQRGHVEAPHARAETARPANPSFHPQPATQRGRVEAPHDRAQAARPANPSFRPQRAAPPQRTEFRQPAARPAPASRRAPPAHSSDRGKARPEKPRSSGPGH